MLPCPVLVGLKVPVLVAGAHAGTPKMWVAGVWIRAPTFRSEADRSSLLVTSRLTRDEKKHQQSPESTGFDRLKERPEFKLWTEMSNQLILVRETSNTQSMMDCAKVGNLIYPFLPRAADPSAVV